MAAIGPSLPPHLAQKRKRSASASPSEDGEDGAAPRAAPALRSRSTSPQPKRSIGPSLPPGIPSPSGLAESHTPPKRVLGPSLPPAPLDELPVDAAPSRPIPETEDAESSTDDDFGPALPPPAGSRAQPATRTTRPSATSSSASTAPEKPQRDDWMLAPPSGSDWTARVDPTKMKNRKFQTGPMAGAGKSGGGVSGLWTESPEEKRRRLEDEVLGSADGPESKLGGEDAVKAEGARRKQEDEARETKRRVAEYDAQYRGKESLVEKHGKKRRDRGKGDDDDPSKRNFDYEKDVAGGGLSGLQQKNMLSQAKTMGSKFETGRFL